LADQRISPDRFSIEARVRRGVGVLFPALAVALIALTGCFGRPFPTEAVARLTPGVTTAGEAESMLGPAFERINGKTGFALTWVHARGGVYGIGTGGESLAVLFDYDTGKMIRVLSQAGFGSLARPQSDAPAAATSPPPQVSVPRP
jgi:hypothetical protein